MKIRNLLLALSLVAVPSTAQAQACADVAACVMTITGTIASNVTASVVSTINFGTIGAATQTADGEFQIVANQPVGVGVAVTNLTNSNDGTSIALIAECAKGGASFDAGAGFFGGGCASESLTAGTNSVWVRGSITAGTATAGIYSGTATLTVTYASF